jgi:hypothetical protein
MISHPHPLRYHHEEPQYQQQRYLGLPPSTPATNKELSGKPIYDSYKAPLNIQSMYAKPNESRPEVAHLRGSATPQGKKDDYLLRQRATSHYGAR